jgi:hypothetical protein
VGVYLFQTLFVKIDGLKIVEQRNKPSMIWVIVIDNGRRIAYNGLASTERYGPRRC